MGRWVMADCVYNTVILPTIPITRYSSPMDPTSVFSSKAEIYARCRWNYAPEAIEAIFQTARLHSGSVVADMGAGTGILTRHFIGRVAQVYAVEPNDAMAGQARRCLANLSGWTLVSAPAERSTLTGASIDLITAAHVLDWLQADAARAEFQRIARPGGWLAVITNRITNAPLLERLPELSAHARPEVEPASYRPPAARILPAVRKDPAFLLPLQLSTNLGSLPGRHRFHLRHARHGPSRLPSHAADGPLHLRPPG
jgi:SAM-dependent methyltransferase